MVGLYNPPILVFIFQENLQNFILPILCLIVAFQAHNFTKQNEQLSN